LRPKGTKRVNVLPITGKKEGKKITLSSKEKEKGSEAPFATELGKGKGRINLSYRGRRLK